MAALSRRRFLGAAVSVGAAAGVIAVGGGAGALLGRRRDVEPDPVEPPAVPPALGAAIAREQGLLRGYAAAGASAGLAERTAAIVADHTEHLRVLAVEQARITGAVSVASVASTIPSASGPTSAPPPPVPLDAVLATLAGLESAAAADGSADCLAGLGGDAALADLHVLLGCIAASEAVHAAMLQ